TVRILRANKILLHVSQYREAETFVSCLTRPSGRSANLPSQDRRYPSRDKMQPADETYQLFGAAREASSVSSFAGAAEYYAPQLNLLARYNNCRLDFSLVRGRASIHI